MQSNNDDDGRNKPQQRRRRRTGRGGVLSVTMKAEEEALTDMLFGGGGAGDTDANGGGGGKKKKKGRVDLDDNDIGDGEVPDANGAALFAIDRTGEETEGAEVNDVDEHQPAFREEFDDEDDSDDDDVDENVDGRAPVAAWQDEDDDNNQKSLTDKRAANRTKKLRRSAEETDPLSLGDYESRLRERFVDTAERMADTSWATVAKVETKKEKDEGEDGDEEGGVIGNKMKRSRFADDYDSDDDESASYKTKGGLFSSTAPLYASSSSSSKLPPHILSVLRMQDGNAADPNKSVVRAVQFLPTKDNVEAEERPLMMTAGLDKTLRFFRVDGKDNEKIHGIQFPTMPIHCASFLGDSGSVVLSGQRSFFYVYDAASGNIDRVPGISGRSERSLEKFIVSPDGRIIAFLGNDGFIILVDAKSRRWMGDLKINGSVRAATFTPDGEYLLGSGSDGDVYRFHVGSRRCVERFRNEDGTITSTMAASSKFLAVGAESGVVNLYDDKKALSSFGGMMHQQQGRTPVKSIMNLQTSADAVKFNGDGQILAMSTKMETGGLKLLHVPTATVFSNWPTSKTPLKYVWSMDFSPGSRFFAVGDDKGKCLLYKLKHYCGED